MNPMTTPTAEPHVSSKTLAPTIGPGARDVVLRDGSTMRVRAIRSEDESALCDFFRRLSAASRAQRFCGAVGEQSILDQAHRQTHADDNRSVGLVATLGRDERIVAHAEYVVTRDGH